MAKQKLKYTDIAEKDLLEPLIDETKELIGYLKELRQEIIETAKVNRELAKTRPLSSYTDIERLLKALLQAKERTEKLSKVERDRIRLEKQLAALEDERAKTNADLALQLSERRKLLREEAKVRRDGVDLYKQESKRLTDLRKQYKNLVLANKGATTEAKNMLKEIKALSEQLEDLDETVGQQFRRIGRYERAIQALKDQFPGLTRNIGKTQKAFRLFNSTLGKLGVIAAVTAALGFLKDAFASNQEGADSLEKAMGRVTITARVFIQRLFEAGKNLGAFFKQIGVGFKAFRLEAKLFFAELPGFLGGSEEKAKDLKEEIASLREEQKSLAEQTKEGLFAAFKGMNEEIANLISLNDQLIDKTTQFRKDAIRLTQDLAELTKQQEILQQAADDNTTSLEAQTKAATELLEVNEQIAEKNEEIAQTERDLAALRVQTRPGNLEAQEELAAAEIALTEAKAAAEIARLETLARLREIERDNIELDLDQLIDLADRRKTINETIAKDESVSLQKRTKAVRDAIEDIDKSFRAQAQKIQEGTEVLFNIDDLINEEDTVELNKRIKALGLDEIRQNRLREIIQERVQAVEDLRTAQNDLNKAEQTARDIQKEILFQEDALRDLRQGKIEEETILAELEERRLNAQLNSLRDQIEAAEEGSVERLRLQKELNDLLIEQAQQGADEEVKVEKDKYKEIKQLGQEAFDFLSDLRQQNLEEQLEAIEEEIDNSQEREDQLRALAAAGNQTAEDSIAAEQKRRADLELQRAEQLKRQKIAELQLAAIEVYGNLVAAGRPPGQAVGETLGSLTLLRNLIEALPGFNEGTELVSRDLPKVMEGTDGYLTRVDGGERILTSAQNSMIPRDMTNAQLAHLASGGSPDMKEFWRLERKLDEVKGAIERKPTYLGMDFEQTRKAVTFTIAEKGRLTRKHKSIRSVFG